MRQNLVGLKTPSQQISTSNYGRPAASWSDALRVVVDEKMTPDEDWRVSDSF